MLNFLIALAVQPICFMIAYTVIGGVIFIHQEICAEVRNLKQEAKQALWDAEWQWKLLRKDIERWQKR